MSFDTHKNFAISTVATAPSPATSGTSLVVAAGTGSLFPATPFNAVIWPTATNPTTTNAEVVRVTNISTDTLTITRAQESSSARTVVIGDQIMAGITAKTLTDIEGYSNAYSATPGDVAAWHNSAFQMCGYAQSFTPSRTGNVVVLVTIEAGYKSSNAVVHQLRYGTNGAPSNQGADTGTAIGAAVQTILGSSSILLTGPVPLIGYVSGLPIGTTHWFDIATKNSGTSSLSPAAASFVIFEV